MTPKSMNSFFDPKISATKFQKVGGYVLFNAGRPMPLWAVVLTLTPESAPYAFWVRARVLLSIDTKPMNNASEITELRVGDLWLPPSSPFKEKYPRRVSGRTDDSIIFSIGVNLFPASMQAALSGSLKVQGRPAFRAERFQPTVLIELAKDVQESDKLTRELWDQIVQCQYGNMPSYSRIQHTHML